MRIKATWGIGDGAAVGYLFGANGLAVSDTANHDSTIIVDLRMMDGCGFQLTTTGTLAGAWKVLQSMNYSDGSVRDTPAAAGTFDDITSLLTPNPAAVVTGGSDQYVQLGGGTSQGLTTFFGGFIKVRFTATSGSGTIQALALAKSVGS